MKLNDRLQSLLDNLFESSNPSLTELRKHASEGFITHEDLLILSKHISEKSNGRETLMDYLKGSRLCFPKLSERLSKANPEPTPELLKRREYLRVREEARAYNRMIHGTDVNPLVQQNLTYGNVHASVKNQLSIGANVIVSMAACGGIAYYAGTQYSSNKSVQMVFGLMGAVGIMIIEVTLFMIRAVKMESVFEGSGLSSDKESIAEMRSGSLMTVKTMQKFQNNRNSLGSEVSRIPSLQSTSNVHIPPVGKGGGDATKDDSDSDFEADETFEKLHLESKKNK